MKTARHLSSPEVATSSLTLAVEVFAQWEAGRIVVLDNSGITVDGKKWKQPVFASSNGSTQQAETFKLKDGNIVVGYAEIETQFKYSVGLKYIHLLLARKPISPSQLVYLANCPGPGQAPTKAKAHDFKEGGCLEGLGIQTDSKDPLLPRSAHNIIRNGLPKLKWELQLLNAAGDREGSIAHEEQIEAIEQLLKKAHFKGFEHAFSHQYKNDLDSVRVAINRAIKSIGTVNPMLAWHLTVSIKFGAKCIYRPEKNVIWDL